MFEFFVFFFFQAEDGIRDDLVTGVQTCALPFSFEHINCSCPPNVNENTTRGNCYFVDYDSNPVIGLVGSLMGQTGYYPTITTLHNTKHSSQIWSSFIQDCKLFQLSKKTFMRMLCTSTRNINILVKQTMFRM